MNIVFSICSSAFDRRVLSLDLVGGLYSAMQQQCEGNIAHMEREVARINSRSNLRWATNLP